MAAYNLILLVCLGTAVSANLYEPAPLLDCWRGKEIMTWEERYLGHAGIVSTRACNEACDRELACGGVYQYSYHPEANSCFLMRLSSCKTLTHRLPEDGWKMRIRTDACANDGDCVARGPDRFLSCRDAKCVSPQCASVEWDPTKTALYVGDSESLRLLQQAEAASGIVHALGVDGVSVNACLDGWLQQIQSGTCVLINFGLHDLENDTGGTGLDTYAALVRGALSRASTYSKCVAWVTTTPVHDCAELGDRAESRAELYNSIAQMEAFTLAIPIIDLHTFTIEEKLSEARIRGKDCDLHFDAQANTLMAAFIHTEVSHVKIEAE